jgi:hypothetical protein
VSNETDLDDRLAALGIATEALGPRPGFSRRVMEAVWREPASFPNQVVRLARRIVPVAATIFAIAAGWAVRMNDAADEAMAASYGAVEEEW